MARSIEAHAHHAHAAQQTQARLARKLAQLDRNLTHAVRDGRLARLSESDRAAFAANAATDHDTIVVVTDARTADGSDVNVSTALAVLDDFGPHAYVVGVNIVRYAERLAVKITALTTVVPADSTQADDLAAATPCSPPSPPTRSPRARMDPRCGPPSTPSRRPRRSPARSPTPPPTDRAGPGAHRPGRRHHHRLRIHLTPHD